MPEQSWAMKNVLSPLGVIDCAAGFGLAEPRSNGPAITAISQSDEHLERSLPRQQSVPAYQPMTAEAPADTLSASESTCGTALLATISLSRILNDALANGQELLLTVKAPIGADGEPDGSCEFVLKVQALPDKPAYRPIIIVA